MSVYTSPALDAVDFALTAVVPSSTDGYGIALSSYSPPTLSAVDFALTSYSQPTFLALDFEFLPTEEPEEPPPTEPTIVTSAGSARRGHRVRFQNHFTIGDKHYVFDSEYGLIRVLAELVQKANVPIAKKLKINAPPVRVYEPDDAPIVQWDEIELPTVNMATADALIAQSVKFGQDEIVSAIEQMIRRRREEEEELLMLAAFLH